MIKFKDNIRDRIAGRNKGKNRLFALGFLLLPILPMQCGGGPPPVVQCAGGIERTDTFPQAYIALCSTGEGWVEVEYQCLSRPPSWGVTWWTNHMAKAYRTLNYSNGSSDPMWAPVMQVGAYCNSTTPYLWFDTVIVYTYQ